MPRNRISVTFASASCTLPYPREAMLRIARRAYRQEGIATRRGLSVVLCSDAVIHRLNARYRKVDRPTDVLSFQFDEPDLLGEIYISLPRCRKQAREYGVTYSQEVQRMFVHGMVHLLGHDHRTTAQRRRMEAVERKYCGK